MLNEVYLYGRVVSAPKEYQVKELLHQEFFLEADAHGAYTQIRIKSHDNRLYNVIHALREHDIVFLKGRIHSGLSGSYIHPLDILRMNTSRIDSTKARLRLCQQPSLSNDAYVSGVVTTPGVLVVQKPKMDEKDLTTESRIAFCCTKDPRAWRQLEQDLGCQLFIHGTVYGDGDDLYVDASLLQKIEKGGFKWQRDMLFPTRN